MTLKKFYSTFYPIQIDLEGDFVLLAILRGLRGEVVSRDWSVVSGHGPRATGHGLSCPQQGF